ncbi:hypothetical protein C5B96_07805 [Subtercola sp. Z020]|nr:hypothetical protein C5B96_07805 [Subtercola sp. Z020]
MYCWAIPFAGKYTFFPGALSSTVIEQDLPLFDAGSQPYPVSALPVEYRVKKSSVRVPPWHVTNPESWFGVSLQLATETIVSMKMS